jgi:hypothetical protein
MPSYKMGITSSFYAKDTLRPGSGGRVMGTSEGKTCQPVLLYWTQSISLALFNIFQRLGLEKLGLGS